MVCRDIPSPVPEPQPAPEPPVTEAIREASLMVKTMHQRAIEKAV